jgi:uncharacterized membrane protein
MFGRNGARGAVADAADTVTPYAEQLVADEKLRQRVLAAVGAALAARQRVKRQAGFAGAVTRLAADPVLRAQVAEMVLQLQKARQRVDRKQSSHKLRNFTLFTIGLGAAAAALPSVRRKVFETFGGGSPSTDGWTDVTTEAPTTIEEEIEVAVPVATAYNQWTQFEEFPKFMDGVDEVKQLDDTLLHWAASIAGKHAEWDAKIIDQQPDRRISWESVDGKQTRGTVTFADAGPDRTRVRLTMTYRPEGLAEKAGSAAGLDRRRIRGDLERFRELIENRGVESGAWRGEVHGGVQTS